MSIQLGTVAPIGFPDFASPQWLACFQKLGCTVVQAYRNQEAKVTIEQMRDYIAAGGLPCDSLHGVFGEQFDPSACQDTARRFSVDSYRKEGELVLQLGGSLVVVHCATIRKEPVPLEERRVRLGQLRKSVAELGAFGRQIGVTYAFENLPGYHAIGYDVAELASLLGELAAPGTGMCFDTGHALMVGDPAAAVRAAGRQILYVHFSDNSGKADEHLMPTYGSMDCFAVADALHDVGYHGTVMLEVFHPLDRLKQMIDEGCGERLAAIVSRANGRLRGTADRL